MLCRAGLHSAADRMCVRGAQHPVPAKLSTPPPTAPAIPNFSHLSQQQELSKQDFFSGTEQHENVTVSTEDQLDLSTFQHCYSLAFQNVN